MACFLRQDAVPADLLGTDPEGLRVESEPVPVTVALPPPEDRAFADVWSALGGELKPSIDLVVSAPVDTGQHFEAGPPVTASPTLTAGGLRGWPSPEHVAYELADVVTPDEDESRESESSSSRRA